MLLFQLFHLLVLLPDVRGIRRILDTPGGEPLVHRILYNQKLRVDQSCRGLHVFYLFVILRFFSLELPRLTLLG